MKFQNRGERPIKIHSVPNSFKSFIKQVYQKELTQNINKKMNENNYFRAEISEKEEQLSRLKVRRKIFNNRKNLLFSLKSNFYKSKLPNTYMSNEKLAIIFYINTLK